MKGRTKRLSLGRLQAAHSKEARSLVRVSPAPGGRRGGEGRGGDVTNAGWSTGQFLFLPVYSNYAGHGPISDVLYTVHVVIVILEI